MNCLAVGLGGFAGAVLRYLIGLIPTGETMIFPVKTFCINVIGCIVIGAITVLAAKLSVPPRMILFLKVESAVDLPHSQPLHWNLRI